MRPRPTQVTQDVGIGAAGFFQSIREDGKAVRLQSASGQSAVVVGRLRQGKDRGHLPSAVGDNGVEGIADEITQQDALRLPAPHGQVAECFLKELSRHNRRPKPRKDSSRRQ